MASIRVYASLFLPNVKSEPRAWLARFVLLGAQNVTAMLVGSTALLGSVFLLFQGVPEPLDWIRLGSSWIGFFLFVLLRQDRNSSYRLGPWFD